MIVLYCVYFSDGVIGILSLASILCGCWDMNSSPHAGTASSLTQWTTFLARFQAPCFLHNGLNNAVIHNRYYFNKYSDKWFFCVFVYSVHTCMHSSLYGNSRMYRCAGLWKPPVNIRSVPRVALQPIIWVFSIKSRLLQHGLRTDPTWSRESLSQLYESWNFTRDVMSRWHWLLSIWIPFLMFLC